MVHMITLESFVLFDLVWLWKWGASLFPIIQQENTGCIEIRGCGPGPCPWIMRFPSSHNHSYSAFFLLYFPQEPEYHLFPLYPESAPTALSGSVTLQYFVNEIFLFFKTRSLSREWQSLGVLHEFPLSSSLLPQTCVSESDHFAHMDACNGEKTKPGQLRTCFLLFHVSFFLFVSLGARLPSF